MLPSDIIRGSEKKLPGMWSPLLLTIWLALCLLHQRLNYTKWSPTLLPAPILQGVSSQTLWLGCSARPAKSFNSERREHRHTWLHYINSYLPITRWKQNCGQSLQSSHRSAGSSFFLSKDISAFPLPASPIASQAFADALGKVTFCTNPPSYTPPQVPFSTSPWHFCSSPKMQVYNSAKLPQSRDPILFPFGSVGHAI